MACLAAAQALSRDGDIGVVAEKPTNERHQANKIASSLDCTLSQKGEANQQKCFG